MSNIGPGIFTVGTTAVSEIAGRPDSATPAADVRSASLVAISAMPFACDMFSASATTKAVFSGLGKGISVGNAIGGLFQMAQGIKDVAAGFAGTSAEASNAANRAAWDAAIASGASLEDAGKQAAAARDTLRENSLGQMSQGAQEAAKGGWKAAYNAADAYAPVPVGSFANMAVDAYGKGSSAPPPAAQTASLASVSAAAAKGADMASFSVASTIHADTGAHGFSFKANDMFS